MPVAAQAPERGRGPRSEGCRVCDRERQKLGDEVLGSSSLRARRVEGQSRRLGRWPVAWERVCWPARKAPIWAARTAIIAFTEVGAG